MGQVLGYFVQGYAHFAHAPCNLCLIVLLGWTTCCCPLEKEREHGNSFIQCVSSSKGVLKS